MDLTQEISSHYNPIEAREARSEIIFGHNEEVQKEIKEHMLFIENALIEVEHFESLDHPNAGRQRMKLLSVIDFKEKEIIKLSKQILND